jgi:hypothetical protein
VIGSEAKFRFRPWPTPKKSPIGASTDGDLSPSQ